MTETLVFRAAVLAVLAVHGAVRARLVPRHWEASAVAALWAAAATAAVFGGWYVAAGVCAVLCLMYAFDL